MTKVTQKMKPKQKVSDTLFNFWKDNKNDQQFSLNSEQLKDKWLAWKEEVLENRGQLWYEYYYGTGAIRTFITDKEEVKGLHSVFDEAQWDEIYNALNPHF